jgi:hypothetical protein
VEDSRAWEPGRRSLSGFEGPVSLIWRWIVRDRPLTTAPIFKLFLFSEAERGARVSKKACYRRHAATFISNTLESPHKLSLLLFRSSVLFPMEKVALGGHMDPSEN